MARKGKCKREKKKREIETGGGNSGRDFGRNRENERGR